ncbi:MAG TPA: biotin/lipoyl-containing protein [Vicinamibacterales bacterium]|nr:biotin/lipoyl-containing protein [Vicinamibacterales bacterium]
MTFEIDVGGRVRAVSIERAGPRRFRIVVDGQPRVVDAVRAGEFGLSLIVDGAAASRDVHLAPDSSGAGLLAAIDGRVVAVSVNDRQARRSAHEGAAVADGAQAVVAPMAGRVVRVLVGPGDEVGARQAVIVVEAMKMENELRAPRAGRVKDVTVTAGASVEAGRALVLLE